jgi:gliding motility-associated-like protein
VTTSTPITITVTAAAPTVAITGPSNNATFTAGGTITVTATASAPGGSVAKVEFFSGTTKIGEDLTNPYSFAWTNVSAGTVILTAKVTDNTNNVATSSQVNIVINTNALPTISITSPTDNSVFKKGEPITIVATAADANGTITKVEFFDGTTKLGEDLTSPYSFIWNKATAGVKVLTAKVTDNQNAIAISAAVNVTVQAGNSPKISLTNPSNNTQFSTAATIRIDATAEDSDGTVTKVEFFNGTAKLGEDLTSPYSFVWNNAPAGTKVLTAKVTDNDNLVTTSEGVNIIVAGNNPPIVSLTNPANNTKFSAGVAITINATAADSDGTVTKVEFFNGTTKLGEDLTSPYALTWINAPTGTNVITAKAHDNENGVTTSSAVNVVVQLNEAPEIAITSPFNNDEFLQGNPIAIDVNATDADGTITKVEFFNGTTKLGEDLTAPYSFVWNNASEGSYSLSAMATDNENATRTSEAINIFVSDTGAPVVTEGENLQQAIPRFFSPNDDGVGDYWEWSQIEFFENSQLVVFNRSGQKIYEAMSYNNTWDGKLDGQPLQPGDYYYVLKMSDLTDIKGSVRIIR